MRVVKVMEVEKRRQCVFHQNELDFRFLINVVCYRIRYYACLSCQYVVLPGEFIVSVVFSSEQG